MSAKKKTPGSSSKISATISDADVLERTNKLILTVGLSAKPIEEISELRQCAASMFVAIFESMFRVRVRDIVRVPTYPEDYKRNAQLIIKAITSAFLVDIPHITGASICEGDVRAISDLVDVISNIILGKITKRRSRSRSSSLTQKVSANISRTSPEKKKEAISVSTKPSKKPRVPRVVGLKKKKWKKKISSAEEKKHAKPGVQEEEKKPAKPEVPRFSKATARPKSAVPGGRNKTVPRKQAWVGQKKGIAARPPRPQSAPRAAKRKALTAGRKKKKLPVPASAPAEESADVLINSDAEETQPGKESSETVDEQVEETENIPEYKDEINRLVSEVDQETAGQPLWDLLWKTRATASDKPQLSPKRAMKEEKSKRHRMYKKLLKEQLRSVEKRVELEQDSFKALSRAEAHKRRVEMIQQSRLKQDLRRAALARMARRRRAEERTVEKFFQAALRVDRKRLAEQRAETKRMAKLAEIEKKNRLNNIEETYADRRKMIAEQVKQEERDREIAKYAQKMEVEKMARELREAERKRIKDLVSQLETQDAVDANSDWTGLDALQLEGPQAAGKIRELLVNYVGGNMKDDWAKNAARKVAQFSSETAAPSVLDSVQGGKGRKKSTAKWERKKANEKMQKLIEAYC
jgi:hypothetical protein